MKNCLDYLKVIIALVGVISMWAIFFLRQTETIPVEPVHLQPPHKSHKLYDHK